MATHITDISVAMLKNPDMYRVNDPWRKWIEFLRAGLDNKIFYLKKHKTALGVSKNMVEIWKHDTKKISDNN